MIVELKNERQRLRNEEGGQHNKAAAAYKTSGPGDSHIISHIHFLYQRTLRKFHYPIDILLNYVEFAKSVKSFQMLSRIYAEGIQHHPRTVGLWIEASNFEYFGYVAQDIDNQKTTGGVQGGEDGVSTKIVGSSINNARVLMQRGLRINSNSEELWLQYFTLELHYVQKLRGRKEILELGKLLNDDELEMQKDGGDDNNDEIEINDPPKITRRASPTKQQQSSKKSTSNKSSSPPKSKKQKTLTGKPAPSKLSTKSSTNTSNKKSSTLAMQMKSNPKLRTLMSSEVDTTNNDTKLWEDDTPTLYSALCNTLNNIDGVTGRLEIQEMLTELYRKVLLMDGGGDDDDGKTEEGGEEEESEGEEGKDGK